MNSLKKGILPLVCFFVMSCAGKPPIDGFVDAQKPKVTEKSVYVQAELDFWAALYEPNIKDIQALRAAWVEHGKSFPESKAILNLEKELVKNAQYTVIIALFMTDYDKADILNKEMGWAVWPPPLSVTEMSSTDLVLRALFPVNNTWARYYLLRYNPRALDSSIEEMVVSNRTSRIGLQRASLSPVK